MQRAICLFCCLALTVLAWPESTQPALADDPGQETLDKAVEAKLKANDILDLGNVIQLCQKALKEGLSDENAKIARQVMAAALFDRGSRFAEAVLEANPTDEMELRQVLRIRQNAQADLEHAAELEPRDGQARYLLGKLFALPGGDEEKAAKMFSEAIKLAGEDDDLKAKAHLARAELPRKPAERRADYDEAIKLAPGNGEARRARGMYLLEQEKLDEALADIDEALRIDPKDTQAMVLRGACQAAQKKYDEALASFNKAIEVEPRYPLAYLQRARVYLLQERGKEALSDLNKVLTLTAPTPGVLILRASAHQLLGDDDAAFKDIDTVLEAQPNLPEAIRAKALLQAGAGKIAEAIGGLESLQKLGADDVQVQLQLGMLYLGNRQARKAIVTFSNVLKKDAANLTALIGRADAYLQVGQHAQAVADYLAAIKLKSDSSHVLNNLAWVLATSPDDKVRDGEKAIELATQACKLTNYKQGHILSTLAAAYAETGNFEKAIEWSTKAVEIGEEDVKEQLQKELESYKARKPWREKLNEPEAESK